MNTTTGNIILVAILVLLVGFGVWYFTKTDTPREENGPALRVELEGGAEEPAR